jgi:hypothetical protein
MAEETTPTPGGPPPATPAAAPPATPEPPAEPAGKTVPYDRFKEVNERAKQLEREATETKTRLEALEAEKLSDLEKAQAKADKAEARATELEAKAVRTERANLVSRAARAANFADPDDAVAFLSSNLPEDEKSAEAAVKDLAESKPHLLKQEGGTQRIGAPLGPGSSGDVPLGADGKPDVQRGLGQDLLRAMTGGR